jgi:hypothetical protein
LVLSQSVGTIESRAAVEGIDIENTPIRCFSKSQTYSRATA